VIHHEQDVRKEKRYVYVARTSDNRVIMACELYCCLLPQCEALRICHSGFSDRNTRCHKDGTAEYDCKCFTRKDRNSDKSL